MKKVLILIFLILLVFSAAWLIDKRIRADARHRASHLIAVHYIAMVSLSDTFIDPPQNIIELSEQFGGGVNSSLLGPFPDSLVFRPHPGGFDLEEPGACRISLFHKDRLVASDTEWPHWEKSGTKVWKYEGQEIPEGYLNSEKSE